MRGGLPTAYVPRCLCSGDPLVRHRGQRPLFITDNREAIGDRETPVAKRMQVRRCPTAALAALAAVVTALQRRGSGPATTHRIDRLAGWSGRTPVAYAQQRRRYRKVTCGQRGDGPVSSLERRLSR